MPPPAINYGSYVIASAAKQSRAGGAQSQRDCFVAPRALLAMTGLSRRPSARDFHQCLEFGAGDGLLALQVAQLGQQALAFGALGARQLLPEARQVALDLGQFTVQRGGGAG